VKTLVASGLMATLLLAGCAAKPASAKQEADGTQTAKIIVQEGYKPSNIVAKAGKPLKVEFYRDEESDKSCDSELVVPSEDLKMHLPLREGQIVEFKAQPPGKVEFQCGMNMMKGTIEFK